MADLDIAAKVLLHETPEAVLRLALGPVTLTDVAVEPTELPATARQMDNLTRYVLLGEAEPRWLHIEVLATPTSDAPRRMFDYWSRAHSVHDRVSSLLICLKPGQRRGRVPSHYTQSGPGRRKILRFHFEVVRVWEHPTHTLETLGLLPLTPFASDASVERVEQAMRHLSFVQPSRRRAELQGVLAAFAGNVFPQHNWLATIQGEAFMELELFKQLRERAVAEARPRIEAEVEARIKAQAHELIAAQMRERLASKAEPFIASLPHCSEATLMTAAKLIVWAPTPDALVQALQDLIPK